MLKTLVIVALVVQTGLGSPVAKTGPENEHTKAETGVKGDVKECCGHLTQEQTRPARDTKPSVPQVPAPSGVAKLKDAKPCCGNLEETKREIRDAKDSKTKDKADPQVPCCGHAAASPEVVKSPA